MYHWEHMNFSVGDIVSCKPNVMMEPQEGYILAIKGNMMYVHFKDQDKRLEIWVPTASATFISKPPYYRARCLPLAESIRREEQMRALSSFTLMISSISPVAAAATGEATLAFQASAKASRLISSVT